MGYLIEITHRDNAIPKRIYGCAKPTADPLTFEIVLTDNLEEARQIPFQQARNARAAIRDLGQTTRNLNYKVIAA